MSSFNEGQRREAVWTQGGTDAYTGYNLSVEHRKHSSAHAEQAAKFHTSIFKEDIAKLKQAHAGWQPC